MACGRLQQQHHPADAPAVLQLNDSHLALVDVLLQGALGCTHRAHWMQVMHRAEGGAGQPGKAMYPMVAAPTLPFVQ